MNRPTWILCRLIMRLDRIPRYGRLYEVRPPWDDDDDVALGPAQWTWQHHGRWGLNLLDRLGLLWQYIDEVERRHNATSRKND